MVGFFRAHLGFHVGFLIRSSYPGFFLRFLWVSPRVFFYKQERIKQKNRKNKEAVKTGSREAKEQEVEQQKHMTKEKNK